MNLSRTPSHSWVARQRGSALILTMLILLVLTALGMVAMHSVQRSVRGAGAYRVRTQAAGLSKAALIYSSRQAGRDADLFWNMMEAPQANSLAKASDLGSPLSVARRGAFVKFRQRAGQSSTDSAFRELTGSDNTTETGLLGDNATPSFESSFVDRNGDSQSEISVVVRDPVDGPPAPGYGENYCFKKVTIASRGVVGRSTADWSGAGLVADKRHTIETYIGPIDCGAH